MLFVGGKSPLDLPALTAPPPVAVEPDAAALRADTAYGAQ